MFILFIKSFIVCPCFFLIYVFFFHFDALSRKKRVLCKFSILTNISFSFGQNLMELHSYIVYLKFHHMQLFLYACQRRDVLCYHPWREGGYPILCPEHISKTMLATVMKLHGWIDLIKA